MLEVYWRVVLRPQFRRMLVVAASALFAAIAEVASIGLIVPVIALFSDPDAASASPVIQMVNSWLRAANLQVNQQTVLFSLLVGMATLMVVRNLLLLLNGYLVETTGARIYQQMLRKLFQAHLTADYGRIASMRRGEMLHNIQGPADSAMNFVLYTGSALAAGFELLVAGIFLLSISAWTVVVIVIFGVILRWLLRQLVQKPLLRYTHHRVAALQDGAALLVEGLDGVRVIKSYNLIERIMDRLNIVMKAQFRYLVLFGMLNRVPTSLFEVAGALLLVSLAGISLVFPALHIEFSALAAFAAVMLRMLPSLNKLNLVFTQAAHSYGTISILDQTLNVLVKEPAAGTQPVPAQVTRLDFEGVGFAYRSRNDDFALHGIDLTFERGKMIAVTGPTGAGKTTLAELIIRLYAPDAGCLRANGLNIQQFPLSDWRARVGYVSQETFLFNASLRDNLTLFEPNVPDERVIECAQLAQLHDFVVTLPDGYATLIGDRGMQISGGQRQRLAVARALLRQPDILILDEATSALDNLTERAFQEAISLFRHNSILIIIAHRLSTVEDADEIVVLRDGCIVERGTHAALLIQHGHYWRLNNADRPETSDLQN